MSPSLTTHTAVLHLQHTPRYPRMRLTATHNGNVAIGGLSRKDSPGFCSEGMEGDSLKVGANPQLYK